MTPAEIIKQARAHGARTLSEHQSKQVLAAYGVPVTAERLAVDADTAAQAAAEIGFPVALKGNAPDLAHKTEAGLVEIGLTDADAVRAAAARLMAKLPPGGNLLVQEMASGKREFLIGMARDDQYGPCVTFGLGGNPVIIAGDRPVAVDALVVLKTD